MCFPWSCRQLLLLPESFCGVRHAPAAFPLVLAGLYHGDPIWVVIQWEYRFPRYAALPWEPLVSEVLWEYWIQQHNDFVVLLQRNTETKLLSEDDRQRDQKQSSELIGFIFMF